MISRGAGEALAEIGVGQGHNGRLWVGLRNCGIDPALAETIASDGNRSGQWSRDDQGWGMSSGEASKAGIDIAVAGYGLVCGCLNGGGRATQVSRLECGWFQWR